MILQSVIRNARGKNQRYFWEKYVERQRDTRGLGSRTKTMISPCLQPVYSLHSIRIILNILLSKNKRMLLVMRRISEI
jgi:hypothetical protein